MQECNSVKATCAPTEKEKKEERKQGRKEERKRDKKQRKREREKRNRAREEEKENPATRVTDEQECYSDESTCNPTLLSSLGQLCAQADYNVHCY